MFMPTFATTVLPRLVAQCVNFFKRSLKGASIQGVRLFEGVRL